MYPTFVWCTKGGHCLLSWRGHNDGKVNTQLCLHCTLVSSKYTHKHKHKLIPNCCTPTLLIARLMVTW